MNPKQVGGPVLDGPIPRPGGSSKRERSRGERRRGKKAKRNKSTRSRSSNEVRGIIIHAVIALTHTQLCECYHVGGDVIAYAACRADPNTTIRITRLGYVVPSSWCIYKKPTISSLAPKWLANNSGSDQSTFN